MADYDEITRFLVDKAVRQEFGYPDWPRGTKVVVFARKEYREKALMKMSQMGYAVSKFVEVDGLQAKLMGEGRFVAIKAKKAVEFGQRLRQLVIDMTGYDPYEFWKNPKNFETTNNKLNKL